MKDKRVSFHDVLEKFGVVPKLVPDAQGLIGDTSDNIPGVPGVGPKTAAKLLGQYGTLDNVLFHGAVYEKDKLRQKLIDFREQALMSRELATLRNDIPLPVPLKGVEATDVDSVRLLDFARLMEFSSFAADVAAFYRMGDAA